MEVQCDENAGIFKLQDIRVYDSALVSTEHKGQRIKKTQGVSYSQSTDNIVIADPDETPVLARCKLQHATSNRTFTVKRTNIDGGNVQRRCGAALSAEITLFIDETPVAIYPSAKTDCYQNIRLDHHPRITFSNGRLKICERMPLDHFGQGAHELQQHGEICRIGSIEGHIARQNYLSVQKDSEHNTEIDALSNVVLREKILALKQKQNVSVQKIAKIEEKSKQQASTISNLEDQLREARQSHIGQKACQKNYP